MERVKPASFSEYDVKFALPHTKGQILNSQVILSPGCLISAKKDY
jgi:hypothetical protein